MKTLNSQGAYCDWCGHRIKGYCYPGNHICHCEGAGNVKASMAHIREIDFSEGPRPYRYACNHCGYSAGSIVMMRHHLFDGHHDVILEHITDREGGPVV